jgi:hypothetical protein
VADDVSIRVRLLGGKPFARDTGAIRRNVKGVADETTRAERAGRLLNATTSAKMRTGLLTVGGAAVTRAVHCCYEAKRASEAWD